MSIDRMNLTGKVQSVSDEIIGIDLGTTNSAVSVYTASTVPTLLSIGENGKYTVPSCVRWDGYNEEGKPVFTVGAEAYRERYKKNVAYSVKRIMGSNKTIRLVLSEENTGAANAIILTPAQVSGEILRYLKNRVAEFYRPVTKCVITVPAYFDQRQIQDTLKAAEYAGLTCLQILKEPTSASYIYSQLGYATNGSILIYDLGGGTFDVTYMTFLRKDMIPSKMITSLRRQYGIELGDTKGAEVNDQYFCRILGTYGDIRLGGDDIDRAMAQNVIKNCGVTLSNGGMEKLYLSCEEFKKMGIAGRDMEIEGKKLKLQASDLDRAVDKIFEKTMDLMQDISASDVKTIVLVGGSTKNQRIRDNLARAFPNAEISAVLDPDATVAQGAGSVAKAIANKKELMYADVLPLPIGILVDESRVETCIEKNTSMPYTVSRKFNTIHDDQSQITLHVYQGLSDDPKECTYLGKLTLTDIPIAPAGDVEVGVSFILDGQGRLKIRSQINGIARDEELVIDNVFDVTNLSAVTAEEDTSDWDSFEECFIPILKNTGKDFEDLFKERRLLIKEGSSTEDVENRIVELAMS